jgi:hypothetical protein
VSLSAKDATVKGGAAAAASAAAEAVRGVAADRDALRTALENAKAQHGREMESVEARMKAAFAKKDEVVVSLRDQLAGATAQLRATESILELQRVEMMALGR